MFIFLQKFHFFICLFIKRKDCFIPYSVFSSMVLIKVDDNLARIIGVE